MTITLAEQQLPAVDTGVIHGITEKGSAFQTLGTQIPLSATGAYIRSLENIKSFGVGEGQDKTASGTARSLVIGNNKFVAVVVLSDEAARENPRIAEAIFKRIPTAHADSFDGMASGEIAIPVGFYNFGTLADAPVVPIGVGGEASVDFDDAEGEIGLATGLAATPRFISYLKRQRTAQGMKALDIDITRNLETGVREGTVNGIPFQLINSTGQYAYIGDFKANYFWGVADVEGGENFYMRNQGNITDVDGVEHNLTGQNKRALFGASFYGSGVTDVNAFRKLVPATV